MATCVDFSRRLPLFVIAVGLALGSTRASAEAPRAPSVKLVWVRGEGAEGCSDGTVVARSVSARLGKNVFSESGSTSIEGVIERRGQEWQLHLYMRSTDGRLVGVRHLSSEGTDCAALDAAATLAVALAIDPNAALRAPLETHAATSSALAAGGDLLPSAQPSPPEAPSPERGAVRANALDAQPGTDLRWRETRAEWSVRAMIGTGILPNTSAGVGLSMEVALGHSVHATTGAAYWPEGRTDAGDFAFGLTAGWGGACVRSGAARVDLSFCGKMLLGAIHAVVFVLEPTEPGDRLWAAGALSAQARLRVLGPIIAEFGVEGLAPMTRTRFLVGGHPDPVFRESAVAGVGFAGLGLTIP